MVDLELPYFDPSVQLAGVQYEYNHKQKLCTVLPQYELSSVRDNYKLFDLYYTAYWSNRLDWRDVQRVNLLRSLIFLPEII